MATVLYETIDYLTLNLHAVAFRAQPARLHAGIALLDKHRLWKPRGKAAKHASAAIVQVMTRIIYNLFGDASETSLFRRAERQCGAECARVVVAFSLQKHRLVKEFWTFSRFGRARPTTQFR